MTYVAVRARAMSRVQEYAPRYGSGLAPTVRLCIGAVLPEPNSDGMSDLANSDGMSDFGAPPPELDELVDTTSLDP